MRKNKNAKPMPGEALTYNESALADIMSERKLCMTNIMGVFGMSNPQTVKRWMAGESIYTDSFVKILNVYDIDLLRFFAYRGHQFTTTLAQLAELEDKGVIAPLIAQLGYEVPIFQGNEEPTADDTKQIAEQPTSDNYIIERQREIIETQRELINNLKMMLNAKRYNVSDMPARMVADNSEKEYNKIG